MSKLLTQEQIQQIKDLRRKGFSMPEIKKKVNVGYGTVFRYIQDVRIDSKYYKTWFGKRGGSRKRKANAELKAVKKAKRTILNLSTKEKIIFLTALYWGEGAKLDFSLSNTDPNLIKTFIKGLINIFQVKKEDLRISVRIYEDLDRKKVLEYWSKITSVPINKFIGINILKGRKQGKLLYGMCRVRITRGGNLLKYIKALKQQVIELF